MGAYAAGGHLTTAKMTETIALNALVATYTPQQEEYVSFSIWSPICAGTDVPSYTLGLLMNLIRKASSIRLRSKPSTIRGSLKSSHSTFLNHPFLISQNVLE